METLELRCHNHNDYPLLYKIGRAVSNKFGQIFRVPEVKHSSCNTGTRALLDMSALPLGAAHPWASCVHIRQCTCASVTTITYIHQETF